MVSLSPAHAFDPFSPPPTPTLIAQQVLDGLPPPPPIPDLQPAADTPSAPTREENTPEDETSGELYMVYVNGDSPLLLEQVQQVEPAATIQPYEGQQVILVGMFDRASSANEQVEQLDERGIEADVVSVSRVVLTPSSTQQPALADLPPANVEPNGVSQSTISVTPPPASPRAASVSQPEPSVRNVAIVDNAYYVVIPGQEESLGEIREQVILLGALPNAVAQRDRPLGPHLLVGPFVDQSAASRWNRFFQRFGMDARVYYKR